MTSKESIKLLDLTLKKELPESQYMIWNSVKRDLEVLETIKANKNIIFSKKPNYEDMSADDFFKLSRWLENVES